MSQGTQKHKNNIFPNTRNVKIPKIPEMSHNFNQHNSSLARHVNAASRKGVEIQA